MPKKQIGKKIDEQGNLTDLGYTVTQEEINNWNNKVDKDSYQEITGQKVFSKPIRTGNANSENDFRIGTEIDQSGVITCKNDMDGANFRTIVKIPTIKDTIIDINLPQKSGTIATTDDIPTNNNQLTNGAEYINKDVNNLTNYTLATNTASSIEMSIDNSTYVVSLKLKNAEGTQLGETQTIDLPLESVVVNGAYDSTTKEVILTLDNGNEIRFSVADLVSGLATTSDLNNYLPLSGGTVSGNITFPFGKGLYTADGKNLLICYADKNLYVGGKDKKFYVNGVEDRPLYNCPKGVYELALLSDCPTQQEKEFLTSEYEKSLNLLNALAKVQTINGATLIIDNNGKCTWSGTSTGAFGFSYTNNINLKPNTTYTFKVFNQTGTLPFAIYFYDYDKSVSYGSLDLGTTTNGSSTFTTPDDIGTNIKFDSYIQANLTLNGSFQVMCVEGSTAPVTYQPYNGAIVHEKDIEDCAKKTDILNKLDKTAGIQTMWSGTQSEYDAITTKDATTLYFIKEE